MVGFLDALFPQWTTPGAPPAAGGLDHTLQLPGAAPAYSVLDTLGLGLERPYDLNTRGLRENVTPPPPAGGAKPRLGAPKPAAPAATTSAVLGTPAAGADGPTAFYQQYWPVAQQMEQQTGIPAAAALAIAAHESGYGTGDVARQTGNLFSIKGPGQQFNNVWEVRNGQNVGEQASFRNYTSPADSFRAFTDLMQTPLYATAYQQRSDPNAFVQAVKAAGYATDPNWANAVTQQMSRIQAVQPWMQAAVVPTVAAAANATVFPVQGYVGAVQAHHGSVKGGSDIMAPAGTPVVAMRGGQVVAAGFDRTGGNTVLIQGDDGNQYYYAHLQATPLVQSGQRVPTGTPLGAVGETGNAAGTGAHLHIGIGPNIVQGVGPYGGTGGDFDALALLQQALASAATR